MTSHFQEHPKNKQIKRPRRDAVKAEVAGQAVEVEVEQQHQDQGPVNEDEGQIGEFRYVIIKKAIKKL